MYSELDRREKLPRVQCDIHCCKHHRVMKDAEAPPSFCHQKLWLFLSKLRGMLILGLLVSIQREKIQTDTTVYEEVSTATGGPSGFDLVNQWLFFDRFVHASIHFLTACQP